ncbi:MAG: phosphatidate cytidylyltransferase [Anaerolineae bacterium]|nr:phosphatidate cytidylyltransferase [Anaerolineae bacterium]
MPHNDLIGFGLFIGYFIVAGLPLILLKANSKTPFEVARKMYHFVIVLSIFPLLNLFSTWYVAVLAALAFLLIVYPVLALVEHSTLYKRIAVERECGEFKRSLGIVQLSLALLITIFWGLLGIDWQYVAVVAVMAWGFGDAAAALVGKKFGRRKIQHPRVAGTKTIEGTLAMYVVAGLSIFLTLLIYAGRPWYVSIVVAALVAPVCSIVELFSPNGMDTITVPLSAAFAIFPLMSLFSFLGV